MENTEGLSPEAMRQEVNITLYKLEIKSPKIRLAFRILANWAYNEGLKARDSVKATEKRDPR